LLQSHLIWF